jgi:hypothetical protein
VSLYFLTYDIVTKKNTYAPGFGIESFTVELIVQILVLLIFGGVLALFIALFLSKKTTFKDRLKKSLPIGISSFCMLLIFLAGYTKIYGKEIIRGVNYNNIEIPKDLNCNSIKNGDFEMTNYTIRRDGDKQTQINLTTNEEQVFQVDWISQCEYTLTDISGSIPKMKVKITRVTSDGYTCYVTIGTHAMRNKIKRTTVD